MANLKKVEAFANEFQALETRNLLEESGIPAFIENASVNNALSYIGSAVGGVRVMVPAERLDEARDLLEREGTAEPCEAWTCGTCFSSVDAGFDVCWKCSSSRDDVAVLQEPSELHTGKMPETIDPAKPADYSLAQNGVTHSSSVQQWEAQVESAWRASVIGLFVCPFFAHLLSLGLLMIAGLPSSRPGDVPSSHYVFRFWGAAAIDVVAMVLLLAILRLWLVG